jgi:hypothetical protein
MCGYWAAIGSQIKCGAQLPVDEEIQPVTSALDHLCGWRGVRAQQTPSHRAAAVFRTQLEADLIMGPVWPQGRPHDQRRPAGLKDLRGNFTVSQIEPGAAAGMARIGQCVPDYPGRRGLCLLLAGKFFHDHEDKQSRTLYAYTADHRWSPAHTDHAADEQGCSGMGIAFDRGPGLTC